MVWKDLDEIAKENSEIYSFEDIEGNTFPRPRMTRGKEKEFVYNAERARMYGNRISHFGTKLHSRSKQERKTAKRELMKVYKTIDDSFIKQTIGRELGYSNLRIRLGL
jgi:hypothetical protein